MPRATVDTSVCPVHFTVAGLNIVSVVSSVVAAGSPFEFAKAVLFIVKVLAFVGVGHIIVARLLPDSFADLHAVLKGSRVSVSVSPPILAITVSFAVAVLSEVHVSVRKLVRTLPMPQTELPLALVSITVLPLMDTIAVSFVLMPLADILVAIIAFPYPIPMLDALLPLSIVALAISPCVKPFAMDFALAVISQVLVAVAKTLVAFAMPPVKQPAAFIDAPIFIDTNAEAMSLLVDDFSTVEGVFVTLDGKVVHHLKLIEIEQISKHSVVQEFFFLLFREHPLGDAFLDLVSALRGD